jgi:hypothetical protein
VDAKEIQLYSQQYFLSENPQEVKKDQAETIHENQMHA